MMVISPKNLLKIQLWSTLSLETLNVSEAVVSSPPNLVNAKKANPRKVNPFIAVRPRKGDHFSKTPNQYDNEYNKSNCDSDKKY